MRFIDRLLSSMNLKLSIAYCLMTLVLSSCVKYDTGINFHSLNDGEFIEHIQLDDRANNLSQISVQNWVTSIEHRTILAQGRIEHISDREFNAIIPFNNAKDLTNKANLYFNPDQTASPDGSNFNAHLQIDQSNFLVVVKNHLRYDIDLRSMNVKTQDTGVSIDPAKFIDLNFSLQSPWGIHNNEDPNFIPGVKINNDRQITWQLHPGKIDRIDATFWLPNPLGIGAILISLITIAGYYLKYHILPT